MREAAAGVWGSHEGPTAPAASRKDSTNPIMLHKQLPGSYDEAAGLGFLAVQSGQTGTPTLLTAPWCSAPTHAAFVICDKAEAEARWGSILPFLQETMICPCSWEDAVTHKDTQAGLAEFEESFGALLA